MWNESFDERLLGYEQEYEASQSLSPAFDRYLGDLVKWLVEGSGIRGKHVVEIGCGDGVFLKRLCETGGNIGYGFDPSCSASRQGRVTYLRGYLPPGDILAEADLVCARHVLEHVPDPLAFLRGLREGKHKERTRYFIEVPNFLWSVRAVAVWDIYYEHCVYFSCDTLRQTLREAGFIVGEVSLGFSGQYIRAEARVADRPERDRDAKEKASLTRPDILRFQESSPLKLERLRQTLGAAGQPKRRIALWGAGARAVTLLNLLGLDYTQIPHVVDINPRKHGTFIAGTGQEIVPPSALRYDRGTVYVANPLYLTEIRAMIAKLEINWDVRFLS